MYHTNHTKLILEHLINDAFFISVGSHHILLDAFCSERILPFSKMPENVMHDILEGTGRFSDVDIILGTHCHGDHFREDDLLECRLDATVILPDDAFSGYSERPWQKMICMSGSGVVWEDDEIRITGIQTVHDGDISTRKHFSYILQYKPADKCLVINGDAQTQPGMYKEWLQDTKVNAVIINFVEPYQEKGRAFLRDLDPDIAIFCHLPVPEDDSTHMGKLSIRNSEKFKDELPPFVTCYAPGTIIEI